MNITERLAAERRGRLAAERLLELKSRELFEANRKLSQHALELSGQIVEQREEAAELKDRNVRAEADLRRAEAQVGIVERRLWDSVETIADGFAVFDAQDRLIAANRAWLSLFDHAGLIQPGLSYLELLRFATEQGIVDIGDAAPSEWIGAMLDRWDAAPVSEVTVKLWNGRHYRLLDRRSRDGDMVCLALDVTATIAREAELRDARARAEAASRAKSAFLANMSHELRTPMNGVVAMTDLLLEGDLDEEQRLYLRTIRSSGDALLAIINDVLDFSRIEADQMAFRPEPFDMERMLHEVLTLVAPLAREKGLDLHVDYDLFLPTRLVGDPGRIRQVLTNLIGNAVKFTDAGHVLIRVVGMEAADNAWQIHVTVEDTGIGIDPDMQEQIFASFAQVEQDRNRSFEGTGLGLAISREIVARMGGQIWVESEKAKGACFGFRVTLPGAEQRHPAPRGLKPGEVRAMMVGSGEDLDQVILSRQLRQLGLEVRQVDTGAKAMQALRSEALPQIVLIDERLPDLLGLDLAAAMREAGLHSATVLLCADPHHAAATAGQESVDATLVRPILRSALFDTLTRLAARQEPSPGVIGSNAQRDALTQYASHADPAATPLPPVHPPRMRVLAAEDNRTNQFVFRKIVKELDIDLAFAGTGREAVDLFRSFAPDLVFMDISMPEMDGKEATRRIRAQEAAGTRIPIIALTAHALAGDREEILAAGLDSYLTKPLRKSEIVEAILAGCPESCRPPLEALPAAAE
ncbi:response regulator [Tropicimonas sediminicola]|uniref:Sensory/regulatory protein RpfC n=1 Tax=Tropicimonas sediminicola TaxID=1031541 RepID=A0A239KU36_9RHOB|nr:response regulator [Tropicimonas sediminicola]SNT21887.1 histidine kinase [Tropicimonas sediminicola]